MNSDPAKMRPVPIQQTMLLLNNFITNTTLFLSTFADSCEKKIAHVSAKINEIEITLAVLEAKLNSIPGLEFTAGDLPSAAAAAPPASAPVAPVADLPAFDTGEPVTTAPAEGAAPTEAVSEPGMVAAKDHPDYAKFFKLVKLGVPTPVIAAKMAAEDLDSSLLDFPEKQIPAPSQMADLD